VPGIEGIKFYTRTKTVTGRWPEGREQAAAGSHSVMPTHG
jgi:malonate-semialdehyde dehydrogenase (acetylating)/methylmalonate-semialdehyde dehydrogenase